MNPARILIIDDDTMLGEQLRSLVMVLGHKATFCGDAQKALALLEETTFDVIFADYWMPVPPGPNLYGLMLARVPEAVPRLVFLIGGVLSDETQFFIRSTGNPQLIKPFKLPAVRQALLTMLQPSSTGTSIPSVAP